MFGDEEIAIVQRVDRKRGSGGTPGETATSAASRRSSNARSAEFQSARYGLCVANGTVALQLALEALDIGAGDEVIVPGLTWQATAGAVLDVNAEPILVDIEPDTYCINPTAVEDAITPRTKAVIAVHLYNCVADLDRLATIVQQAWHSPDRGLRS